jgi:predicted nucleotidyltransferase
MNENELDDELLQALVESIVAALHPEKILLSGSFARGEAGPGSDVDLFVQVETGRSPGEATTKAYAAIRPFRPRLRRGVDIVVKERSFVERYGALVGTVVRPALREGKVLYAE